MDRKEQEAVAEDHYGLGNALARRLMNTVGRVSDMPTAVNFCIGMLDACAYMLMVNIGSEKAAVILDNCCNNVIRANEAAPDGNGEVVVKSAGTHRQGGA